MSSGVLSSFVDEVFRIRPLKHVFKKCLGCFDVLMASVLGGVALVYRC
ncbi:MAG: hypothetical protein H5T50_05775 [Nitrososphaeria archaeon]|nr:hypothetical protein [Nitrososphaeria archaeon]